MSDEQPDEVADPEIDQTQGEPAFDPQQFKADLAAEMDTRIKGFQRLVSKKDEEILNLRAGLSDLSEEERDEQLVSSAQRIADLESQLLTQKYGQERPDDYRVLQRLLAADSDEQMLDLIREIRAAGQPEPADLVADVDANRPFDMDRQSGGGLPGKGGMTDELSMDLLRRFSPGPR
jgi:hypothetical protein